MAGLPRILDWLHADDPRDVVHEAVQRLVQGEIIGLPVETQYLACAYSLADSPIRLAAASQSLGMAAPALVVKSMPEALDYLPRVSAVGRKLLRRFWPGPVTIGFSHAAIGGLFQSLPKPTASALTPAECLHFRFPQQEVLQEIMNLLPAPLVVSGELATGKVSTTATDIARQLDLGLSMIIDSGPLRYQQPTSVVVVDGEAWSIERESVVTARTLQRLAGNFFLFVCTGNTCRSPMAEALCRRLLSEKFGCQDDELVDHGFMVGSAGVAAGDGQPASDESIEQMRLRGIDLSSHESQMVTRNLVAQADRIFTMTRSHREVLLQHFRDAAPRIEVLSRHGADVSDPIGGGDDEYRECAEQIEAQLRAIIDELPSD